MANKKGIKVIESKNVVVVESESMQMISMMERLATNKDVDTDKMQKVLDMQMMVLDRNASQAYASSMVAVHREMTNIKRDAQNPQTGSTYAKLDSINKIAKPILAKHGFSLSFGTGKSEVDHCILVTCDVTHEQGHTKQYTYDSPIDDAGIHGKINKTPTHARGSASSYGRRYLVVLVCNLTIVGEDDDGNSVHDRDLVNNGQHIDEALTKVIDFVNLENKESNIDNALGYYMVTRPLSEQDQSSIHRRLNTKQKSVSRGLDQAAAKYIYNVSEELKDKVMKEDDAGILEIVEEMGEEKYYIWRLLWDDIQEYITKLMEKNK